MPELISSTRVKARKVRECLCCGAVAIHPGQEYQRDVFKFDGRVYTWVSCDDCKDIGGEVFDWCGQPWDEGVGQDQFDEWATEHEATDPRAAAYLARRQQQMRRWRADS